VVVAVGIVKLVFKAWNERPKECVMDGESGENKKNCQLTCAINQERLIRKRLTKWIDSEWEVWRISIS